MMKCWHKWSKWEEVAETRVFEKEHGNKLHPEEVTATWLFVTQERRCDKCGLRQFQGNAV
jgi:hypothetical protein